jgi:hypothetical protein
MKMSNFISKLVLISSLSMSLANNTFAGDPEPGSLWMESSESVKRYEKELASLKELRKNTDQMKASLIRAKKDIKKFGNQIIVYNVSVRTEAIATILGLATVALKVNLVAGIKIIEKRRNVKVTEKVFEDFLASQPDFMSKLTRVIHKYSGRIIAASALVAITSEYAREETYNQEMVLDDQEISALEEQVNLSYQFLTSQENLVNVLKTRALILNGGNICIGCDVGPKK